MLGTLDDTQINNILSSQVVGRLACCDAKQPYIVPVTYTYDGNYIYGQTNEGTKLEILRKNPNVCFEVDTMINMRNWQSVILNGTFEELTGKEAEKAGEIFFNKVYPLLTSSTITPYGHATDSEPDVETGIKSVMYRIKIDEITGRFERE